LAFNGIINQVGPSGKWLNLAGANGDKAARRSRDRLGARMTPAQIAEAQKRARRWMARNGRGPALDDGWAGKWLRGAALQGDPGAWFSLGMMCDMGHDVAQDHAQAMKWYYKAAARGRVGARYNLGVMYYEGYGVVQD
jgi:TPR repeat protein